jgi:SP family sugar:H+ symporter-like MFS transporter
VLSHGHGPKLTRVQTSAYNTYAQICVARLLTGLGIGATSGLVPVFQAEAAPPRYRGLVTGESLRAITDRHLHP